MVGDSFAAKIEAPCPSFVSINGEVVSTADSRISVRNRGLLQGYGLFETIRCERRVAPFLSKHLDRLYAAAFDLGVPVPDRACVEKQVRALLMQRDDRVHRLRIVATRGDEQHGYTTDGPNNAVWFLTLDAYAGGHTNVATRGVKAVLQQGRFSHNEHGYAGYKTLSYLRAALAQQRCVDSDVDEVIAVTSAGEILEGSRSNVFALVQGTLYTPPLALGILPGITRALVLDFARALGVACAEKVLFPSELYVADELIVTSSLMGVAAVTMLDGVQIGRGQPGGMTRALFEQWRRCFSKH